MPDYKIREALPQDLEGLYAVFGLADQLHRQAHPEIFREVDDPADIKDFLMVGIRAEEAAILVADADGEIIGALIGWVRQTSDNPLLVQRTYISLDNLVVAEKYRHHGVGRALMDSLHQWAQARGLKDIHLTVWDFNQGAQAFYRELGYEMLSHRMRKELP